MAINLTKVLCTSAVAALLVCGNAYAGTIKVTNNTKSALQLTLEGDKGNIIPKADMEAPLAAGETKTITVTAQDVNAPTYTLSAKGITKGKCMNNKVDSDIVATFEDGAMGPNCVSKEM